MAAKQHIRTGRKAPPTSKNRQSAGTTADNPTASVGAEVQDDLERVLEQLAQVSDFLELAERGEETINVGADAMLARSALDDAGRRLETVLYEQAILKKDEESRGDWGWFIPELPKPLPRGQGGEHA